MRCPPGVAGIADDLDRYFAAARGTEDIAPLEMTKWFDTNYHYLVPEIGADTRVHPRSGQGRSPSWKRLARKAFRPGRWSSARSRSWR